MNTPTIAQRLQRIRAAHNLSRLQLFTEGRSLYLQMVNLDGGAKGCQWTPERGESMHDALNECEGLLIDQLITI